MHSLLSRFKEEDGVSLTELVVTLFLLGVVSTIFTSVLGSSLTATRNIEGATRANDDARIAVLTIGRELRAAATICSPRPDTPSDMLWFFVKDGTGVAATEIEYVYKVVDYDTDGNVDDLVRSNDGGATYRPVVEDVVNTAVAADLGVAQPLFTNQAGGQVDSSGSTVAASPSYGKVISVQVWVDKSAVDNIGPRLEFTEIAGRNIWTPNAATCPVTPPADPVIP